MYAYMYTYINNASMYCASAQAHTHIHTCTHEKVYGYGDQMCFRVPETGTSFV